MQATVRASAPVVFNLRFTFEKKKIFVYSIDYVWLLSWAYILRGHTSSRASEIEVNALPVALRIPPGHPKVKFADATCIS